MNAPAKPASDSPGLAVLSTHLRHGQVGVAVRVLWDLANDEHPATFGLIDCVLDHSGVAAQCVSLSGWDSSLPLKPQLVHG